MLSRSWWSVLLVVFAVCACEGTFGASPASQPATQPGSTPTHQQMLGDWKMTSRDVRNAIQLKENGSFSSVSFDGKNKFTGTWELSGNKFVLNALLPNGKPNRDAYEVQWGRDGVIQMKSPNFVRPIRLTRGDWPPSEMK